MITPTTVFGRHFLENKVNLSLQRRQPIVFVANDKILVFTQKLEFEETCINYCELDGLSILKNLSDEIDVCDFIMSYYEMSSFGRLT